MANHGDNETKYQPDPLRLLGSLPCVHPVINLQKKTFYKRLVKKGLVYMYDNGYDLDPDSPILKEDRKEDDTEGIQRLN